jgi:hypothetical protein
MGWRERHDTMQLKDLTTSIAMVVPMFLMVASIVALVAWFALGAKGGRGARIAAWLGLTVLSLWCGLLVGLAALTGIYFVFGSTATIIGAVIVGVLLIAMPFFWWYVVRNRNRDDAGTPQAH